MRKKIAMGIIVTPLFLGCSANPIIADDLNFYGENISEVAARFEKKGFKCEKGNFSYPIKTHRLDLLCTYLEKNWICPEQYKIIIPYDVQKETVTGPAYVDRRKLCF